jgi:hypothetical protein
MKSKQPKLYYDSVNDKTFRIIKTFPNTVLIKEVKTNTGRAKMGEPIKSFSQTQWEEFSKEFLPINKTGK